MESWTFSRDINSYYWNFEGRLIVAIDRKKEIKHFKNICFL